MNKRALSKEQLEELVSNNRYKIEESNRFLSRCVDGRYINSSTLPPLAIPGADAGELAIVFATANTYGFTADEEKVYDVLLRMVGGVKNFNLHTDRHGDSTIPASGCGHMKQIRLDPKAYNVNQTQISFIDYILKQAVQKHAKETVLEGDHQEGAVLQVSGPYSVAPQFIGEKSDSKVFQVFVYHESLVKERHKKLAKALIEEKAVKLFSDTDEEYLYEVLTETTDSHLLETLKRLASGLPLSFVDFADDGSFTVKEMGTISP